MRIYPHLYADFREIHAEISVKREVIAPERGVVMIPLRTEDEIEDRLPGESLSEPPRGL